MSAKEKTAAKPRRSYVTVCKSEDVEIDGKPYKLLEMKGPELSEWTNLQAGRLRMVEGKPVGFNPLDSMHSKLVALCLYDGAGKPVDEKTIRGWPASLLKALFEDCQKLNGLDDESQEEEKKS